MLLPHSQPPHKSAGTHLSGTGIGDYGDFLMMPKAKLQHATMAKGMAATISPRNKANAPGAAAITCHAMDE